MFYEEKYCDACKKVVGHGNGCCRECHQRKEVERIRVWEAHDVDTKLTNLRERIEKLERGPIRF